MLCTLALAATLSLQAPGQAAPDRGAPSPAELFSRLLRRYAEAKTLTARVVWRNSAQGKTVTTTTDLQYERPSKISIRQKRDGSAPRAWTVTSDGKLLTYDPPAAVARKRMSERVQTDFGELKVGDMFVAARKSLGDDGPVLAMLISHKDSLVAIRRQIATIRLLGKRAVGESEAYVVGGDWIQEGFARPSARFTAWITEAGDLRRFTVVEMVAPGDGSGAPIEVTSDWEIQATPGAQIDPALFKPIL